MVKKIHVPSRENIIVNRLNKTKVELEIDHQQAVFERERKLSKIQKSVLEQQKQQEKARIKQMREEKELRSYSNINSASMTSNVEMANKYIDEQTGDVDVQALEDDFM